MAITGLGFYELRLNGKKVGDAELDPGFSTNYTERVLYAVHDVTVAVQNASAGGGLVLAARVGAGKYSMAVSHSDTITNSSIFALLCHLTATFSDGTNLSLVTSNKWQVSATPFVSENLYRGEVYDARLELPGWDQLSYSPPAANWSAAKVIAPPALGPGVVLSPRLFPPIRVVKVVTPISFSLKQVQQGLVSATFDLGNNFAGVPHVSLPARAVAGTKMTLTATECSTCDDFRQQDAYIFSGREAAGQQWRPTFVYHGFRYLSLSG
eukprot:SAG31_NODE_6612_length_1953_cov_1.555016_1_plen_266_part_10